MDATYDYTYPTTTVANEGALAGLMAFLAGLWILMLVLLVFYVVCMWKIFVKAGKPGWAALVPIYNVYVLMQIIGKPWWWMLAIFAGAIPVIGYLITLAFGLIVALELGKKFGKDTAFSILALWLFSFVGYPMLAFGSAKYDASAAPFTTLLSGDGAPKAAPTPEAPAAPEAPAPEAPKEEK